jgi:hypothetical protein
MPLRSFYARRKQTLGPRSVYSGQGTGISPAPPPMSNTDPGPMDRMIPGFRPPGGGLDRTMPMPNPPIGLGALKKSMIPADGFPPPPPGMEMDRINISGITPPAGGVQSMTYGIPNIAPNNAASPNTENRRRMGLGIV